MSSHVEDHSTPSVKAPRPIPGYYNALNAPGLVTRLADVEAGQLEDQVRKARNNTFVLDFGKDEAWALYCPTDGDISKLLNAPRPKTLNTRWINIWKPFNRRGLVQTIGDHYGFTPRLQGLMGTEPGKPSLVSSTRYVTPHRGLKAHAMEKLRKSYEHSRTSEDQVELNEKELPQDSRKMLDLNHYLIADEVWHYSSVDMGKKFICIGYNSIYNSHSGKSQNQQSSHSSSIPYHPTADKIVPEGQRVWCWLILCDDGTVITIHEDPTHELGNVKFEVDNEHQSKRKGIMYSHYMDVFAQIANPERDITTQNPMTILPIRKGRTFDDSVLATWPNLLFYYLFDDWFTGYSLVARKKHQYGVKLDRLRQQMLEKAELYHIDKLHRIGRQLAILKKVYQSYRFIIDRLLGEQKKMSMSISKSGQPKAPALGLPLDPGTILKLEAMRDRVSLYALGEIQDCTAEKDALVMMTFNLIAHKESQAVERLTRTTIFLAKITILFLPVTLMTGYFSVQIQDLAGVYTAKTYWSAFGVIMGLSILGLFVFGYVSDTIEGRMVYVSFSGTVFNFARRVVGRGPRKQKLIREDSLE